MNLSLRARLTIWFGLVMAVPLAIFGFLTYTSISDELTTGLDLALSKAIRGIDVFIQKSAAEDEEQNQRPRRRKKEAEDELAFLKQEDSTKIDSTIVPSIQPIPEEEQSQGYEKVWASIAEYVVLSPRNFRVQVLDSTGAIVYRSTNLEATNDSLELPEWFLARADTVPYIETVPQVRFNDDEPRTEQLRMAIAKSRIPDANSVFVIIAYPYDEVQGSLQKYLNTLLLLIPAVLLVSILGGWFLAKTSLRPVDEITQTAQAITASNLSRRLPVNKSNDEIKRLSETLNDMISRLENSFGRIRQFTSDASHELRTPLTILTGELELALRSTKSVEEYQEVISSALQETFRLSRLVEDLLLLSRADLGRITLKTVPTNLNEMLADLAEATTILGAQKNITITYRATNEQLMVNADPPRLYQMFLNLLDNAIKYTPKGGSISLTLYRDQNMAQVHVIDTGIGISDEDQANIFRRFYRVDKARSRELGGVGLGLSIVDWTVNTHNGTIRVESEVGKGSTFIVRLPLIVDGKDEKDEPTTIPEEGGSVPFELSKLLKRSRKGETVEQKEE